MTLFVITTWTQTEHRGYTEWQATTDLPCTLQLGLQETYPVRTPIHKTTRGVTRICGWHFTWHFTHCRDQTEPPNSLTHTWTFNDPTPQTLYGLVTEGAPCALPAASGPPMTLITNPLPVLDVTFVQATAAAASATNLSFPIAIPEGQTNRVLTIFSSSLVSYNNPPTDTLGLTWVLQDQNNEGLIYCQTYAATIPDNVTGISSTQITITRAVAQDMNLSAASWYNADQALGYFTNEHNGTDDSPFDTATLDEHDLATDQLTWFSPNHGLTGNGYVVRTTGPLGPDLTQSASSRSGGGDSGTILSSWTLPAPHRWLDQTVVLRVTP